MAARLVDDALLQQSFHSSTVPHSLLPQCCAVSAPSPLLNRYIRSRRPQSIPPPAIWGPLEGCDLTAGTTSGQYRPLPTLPERILDAPELLDDYYLNLVDWGELDILAVALRNRLYLWNARSGVVSQLAETEENITAVSWAQDGRTLAVGETQSCVSLYDVAAGKPFRKFSCHKDRVSSLAWNGAVLSSGSRDTTIVQSDVRVESSFLRLHEHQQEVCGLQWSPDGQLLASGGNDNRLCLWEPTSSLPRFSVCAHKAAVKALAWCPWKSNSLASGGGTADRSIKLWNTATHSCVQSVDTGSQVCALQWNRHAPELLSAHGYAHNQLVLWKLPELTRVQEFAGHTARVLFLAQNPQGSTVVSAGADETLRFWKIFESAIAGGKCESPCSLYQCR